MKLEVGMYIRTFDDRNRGKIGKIIKNYDNELEIAYKDLRVKTTVGCFLDDNRNYKDGLRVKASYDIMDLIGIGDYVNGYKVTGFDYNFTNTVQKLLCNGDYGIMPIYVKNIKSIVTKEQFESISYKVDNSD